MYWRCDVKKQYVSPFVIRSKLQFSRQNQRIVQQDLVVAAGRLAHFPICTFGTAMPHAAGRIMLFFCVCVYADFRIIHNVKDEGPLAPRRLLTACSFGWWLMASADLF
jgi:hypothetical protein